MIQNYDFRNASCLKNCSFDLFISSWHSCQKGMSTETIVYTNRNLITGLKEGKFHLAEQIISKVPGPLLYTQFWRRNKQTKKPRAGSNRFQNYENHANHSYKETMKKLEMFGIKVKLRGIIKPILNNKNTDLKSIEQSYSVRLQRTKFLKILWNLVYGPSLGGILSTAKWRE